NFHRTSFNGQLTIVYNNVQGFTFKPVPRIRAGHREAVVEAGESYRLNWQVSSKFFYHSDSLDHQLLRYSSRRSGLMSHTREVLAFCLSGLLASLWFLSIPADTQSTGRTTDAPTVSPIFDELADKEGLKFRHFNGMTGKLFLPEVMGAGAALFDFDNDGDLDVFLVQGSTLDASDQHARTPFSWRELGEPRGRLFRN